MPIYLAEGPRPVVSEDMGRVKTNVCLWSENSSSIVDEAMDKLRSKASERGASALVDVRYRMIQTHPRVQVCRRYLQAEATAAHVQGSFASDDR